MNQKTMSVLLERAVSGEGISWEEATELLRLNPESEEVVPVLEAARESARKFSNNQGKIWAAVGVDYQPCPWNCRFCSHGEKWGIMKSSGEWSEERVVQAAVEFNRQGAYWITLRTTQDYGIDRLCDLGKVVLKNLGKPSYLVANTGDFNREEAEKLLEAGFTYVYHPYRLREGIDSGIDPEVRLKTVKAIAESNLKLVYLAEPIGPEHLPEEIAGEIFRALSFGAVTIGGMARVPVNGTPLGDQGNISENFLALVTAVCRLAGGSRITDVCSHPPSSKILQAGANALVVETGAVPRDVEESICEWQLFTIDSAHLLFQEAGYKY
ncbi:MAG: radical SAM protein [Candidatus Contubernalis sp.]|nr:radical SAM protein [Candidatus Contubernalis sp.]